MALEIFKLVGSIFIDTDKANESLAKTDKKATSVAEGFGKVGKVAAGAAAAIGTAVIGTGTALVGMANDASQTADEIDKMSQKIGLSAEGYQEWSYIMEQNGMDVDKLQTGMKTLVNQMDKVQSGNKDAIQTFQDLGVEVMNADGSLRSQEEVMNDTVRALAEMGNTAERAKLATELFGKAGTEMAPMLNQGAQAIDDLQNRAHELGLVMSDDAVKAGVTYGDLSNDLKKSFEMLKTNLGAALFPVLNKVIEKLIEFMPTLQEIGERLGPIASDFIEKLIPPLADLAEELMPILLDSVGDIIPMLADIVSSVVPTLIQLFSQLTPVLMQVVSDVLPILMNLLKLVLPIISTLLTLLSPILSVVLQLLTPLTELLAAILTPILELLNVLLTPLLEILNTILVPLLSILGYLLEPLTALLSAILEPMLSVLGKIISPLLEILNNCLTPIFAFLQQFYAWAAPIFTAAYTWLHGFFDFIIDNVGNKLSSTFEKFGSLVSTVWEGLKSSFKNGINFWINAINTLIRGVNSIKVPDWVTDKIGIGNVNIQEIPALAEGGNIVQAGRVLVGEAGPELLDLPKGARVTPLNDGIDYDRLADALVRALQGSGFGQVTIPVIMDGVVSDQAVINAFNRTNYLSGGR